MQTRNDDSKKRGNAFRISSILSNGNGRTMETTALLVNREPRVATRVYRASRKSIFHRNTSTPRDTPSRGFRNPDFLPVFRRSRRRGNSCLFRATRTNISYLNYATYETYRSFRNEESADAASWNVGAPPIDSPFASRVAARRRADLASFSSPSPLLPSRTMLVVVHFPVSSWPGWEHSCQNDSRPVPLLLSCSCLQIDRTGTEPGPLFFLCKKKGRRRSR